VTFHPLEILSHSPLSRRRFLGLLGASALGTLPCPRPARSGLAQETVTLGRLLMGTLVEIEAHHPDISLARRGVEAGLDGMAEIDRLMSIFRRDSEISRVNRLAGTAPLLVGKDTFSVLTEAQPLARQNGGALDVTVLPLMRLWAVAAKHGRVPTRPELDCTLGLVDSAALFLDGRCRSVLLRQPGMGIDLGGIAKGYAVDVAVEALQTCGIQSGMVNAGGDLRVLGRNRDKTPWGIGLRHPLRPSQLLLSILVQDESVATSGNYFRYFTIGGRQYGHVLNPRTGAPAETALSTTVIAKSAMRADGLATVALVLGADGALALMRNAGTEGIVVSRLEHEPGKVVVHITRGLTGRVDLLDPTAVILG